ncbi:MAG TPA: family 2 encapsulin nanocompartment cargo protein polyprenyl transferase [Pseudonocardiaceae bacterium]|nr:family 2 encapsulin nanocompartment cargo protein polyprenyl transferase [Pseudonocardiaceae bacterium]
MAIIGVKTEGRSAGEVLTWSRATFEPALRAAVDTLPSLMRRIAGYHFGWWNEHGQPERGRGVNTNGGKAIRPTLVLLSAQAVCGVPAAAVPAAAAVELVHNFSLLHDDVLDGDVTRRHRPTAWSVFGRNAAILAGDSLLALALDVPAASGHPAATDGIRMLSAAVQELVEGQSADLAFEQRAEIELAECLRMAELKTGALLACACAIGAAFGGGSPEQIQSLRSFGAHLGLAFQHVDDLLGIWGDPSVTGKPVYSDLRSRKKSLPVVAALTSGTPTGRELAELYHRDEPLSGTELSRAAELIDIAGGRAWSQTQVDDLLAQATRDLHAAGPTARATGELSALARLATHRDH